MENLTDKSIRSALVARYLDAETEAREETLLAEYFAAHAPEDDEVAAARLVLAEHPEALLTVGEREFGPLAVQGVALAGAREARGFGGLAVRRWALAGLAAAAAIALVFLLRPSARTPEFTPVEIAESLSTIVNLGLGDIESVTAVPSGARLIVTVHLKDGTDQPFIMSKDGDTGTLSLASTE